MKIKIGIVVVVLLMLTITPCYGYNTTEMIDELLQESTETIEFDQWNSYMNEAVGNSNYNAGVTIKDILSGNFSFNLATLYNTLINLLFGEIKALSVVVIQLIGVAMIHAFMQQITDSLSNGDATKNAKYICYLLMMYICTQAVMDVIITSKNMVATMAGFMQIACPVLFGFLVFSGRVATASLLQPVVLVAIQVISVVIDQIILPLAILALCICFIDTINGELDFQRLFKLIKTGSTWLLGAVFGIFTTVLSIQNVIGKSADSVALKTAKFTTEAFIPIIGGTFSSSIELVTACAKYLRSAIGITGILAVGMICLAPLIKIFATLIMFRVVGAIIEPVTEKKLGKVIEDAGDIVSIIFAAAAGCALLFFMCLFVASNMLGGTGG